MLSALMHIISTYAALFYSSYYYNNQNRMSKLTNVKLAARQRSGAALPMKWLCILLRISVIYIGLVPYMATIGLVAVARVPFQCYQACISTTTSYFQAYKLVKHENRWFSSNLLGLYYYHLLLVVDVRGGETEWGFFGHMWVRLNYYPFVEMITPFTKVRAPSLSSKKSYQLAYKICENHVRQRRRSTATTTTAIPIPTYHRSSSSLRHKFRLPCSPTFLQILHTSKYRSPRCARLIELDRGRPLFFHCWKRRRRSRSRRSSGGSDGWIGSFDPTFAAARWQISVFWSFTWCISVFFPSLAPSRRCLQNF